MSIEQPSSAYRYDPVAISSESTVVARYEPEAHSRVEQQSEAELEAEFIKLLKGQAYEYLNIGSASALESNLRTKLEQLNGIEFSDNEWTKFFKEKIANEAAGIVDKAGIIQEDHVQLLTRDDGTVKNVYLIDKRNVHNNSLQVINQYEAEGKRATRYDVTILVNGLPLVHIELKRRGIDLREAFNQINRYQRDSFWADSGLFEYVQLFVISNGTYTKYYSNTTRSQHINEAQQQAGAGKRTSNSFEFTSWWADADNRPIFDLVSFTKTFFAKHSLLNVLTKYCVFTSERMLLVMRPYQIVATEMIMQRIVVSGNNKQLGTLAAGGYVWHTTGSGKTLTSFKTAQLASRLDGVDKVLFVVDRKDLDYQTMQEYNRFEEGAANGNTSTAKLKKQIEDPNARIIVTTIQKLAKFVASNDKHEAYKGRYVLIFDECHRSQFGDMQALIRKAFKNYNMFGFTGTPIFAENAPAGGNPKFRTTEQVFGTRLHTYTIVDAINDKNVLPFRIDYVNTISMPEQVGDKQVRAIDTERALRAPERISMVVDYMRTHFNQKTNRNQFYRHNARRLAGFNALFATESIDAAKLYYAEFKRQQVELPEAQRLKVGLIYSFAANEDLEGGLLAEEGFEADGLDASSRDFLDGAIDDFNAMFGTSWSTSSDGFQSYYQDLSKRLKQREIDLVIVVNMFLTGFDATTLNTLWVDKNLRQHGLIQAFSRTNRILNSVKTFGNVVSFRNLEAATNEAIALFGNKDAQGIVLLQPYLEYFQEYDRLLTELTASYAPGGRIVGEQAQKDFAQLWGSILRLRNILVAFDEFAGDDRLTAFDAQNYQSTYLEIYHDVRAIDRADKESILDDVVFEIELIKQVEINVDYILALVKKYQESRGTGEGDKEIRADVMRAVDASVTLRSKRDLIEKFINSLNLAGDDPDQSWRSFIEGQREIELEEIITSENLKAAEARAFVARAFTDGGIVTDGTDLARILPAMSLFDPDNAYMAKRQAVIDKLRAFFDRFFGLTG